MPAHVENFKTFRFLLPFHLKAEHGEGDIARAKAIVGHTGQKDPNA